MKILLVEPSYYTKFPPLGLLKLASYYRSRGNQVKLVRGMHEDVGFIPDHIDVTSLFTYAWKPVHQAIDFYHNKFGNAKIRVGGIYASLIPDRLRSFFPFLDINVGLFEQADNYLPAYDLLAEVEEWKKWDSTILFTSRGCIRHCPYCVVPILEGTVRRTVEDLERFIYPTHKRIILWDNNFFASPNWRKILKELQTIDLPVDFNQGIDSRLIDEEKARLIANLRIPIIRTAFDNYSDKLAVTNAVLRFSEYGINRRKIFVYVLYNFFSKEHASDVPETFFERIKHLATLGCVSYPMRYEPLTALEKNRYVSPLWTTDKLDMVVKARRILGYGGAFPPYTGLVQKFEKAKNFEEAFSVYPLKKDKTNALLQQEEQILMTC